VQNFNSKKKDARIRKTAPPSGESQHNSRQENQKVGRKGRGRGAARKEFVYLTGWGGRGRFVCGGG